MTFEMVRVNTFIHDIKDEITLSDTICSPRFT